MATGEINRRAVEEATTCLTTARVERPPFTGLHGGGMEKHHQVGIGLTRLLYSYRDNRDDMTY